MQQLHIPSSVCCPPDGDPLRTTAATAAGVVVPYAAALRQMRASQQLLRVVDSADDEVFAWLDQDNNSAVQGRIAEQSKNTAMRHFFMYFRIRVADYRAVLNSLAQVSKSESLFSEEKLRKWTISYRFRLFKSAPIKSALRAFSCRLGIESDPEIVFCRDGFYGDPSAGSLTSPTGIPHQMLLGDVTAPLSGLTNGSSIFVSRSTTGEREAAAAVLRVMDEEPSQDEGEGVDGEGSPSPRTNEGDQTAAPSDEK